ncbi:hypothetical protein Tco_0400832 [Tanacetum coccineum]
MRGGGPFLERLSVEQPSPSPAPTNESLPDSSSAQPSEVPFEQQPDPSPRTSPKPSPRPSPTPIVPDSIPEPTGENLGDHSSNDASLSGNEDEMTLQNVYDLCISLCQQVSDQAKEIKLLKAKITKLKKQAKPVIKHHKEYLKIISLQQRFPKKNFSKKQRMHKKSVSKQGRKKAKGESSVQRDPLFEVLPEDKIDHMETENAQTEGRTSEMVDEEKEFDEDRLSTEDEVISTDESKVSTDEHNETTEEKVESTEGQREGTEDQSKEEIPSKASQTPTSMTFGRMIHTTLLHNMSLYPKIDQKTKGKEIEEEENSRRREAEEERNKIAREKATNESLFKNFDDIKRQKKTSLAESFNSKKEAVHNRKRAKFLHEQCSQKKIPCSTKLRRPSGNKPPQQESIKKSDEDLLKGMWGTSNIMSVTKELDAIYKHVMDISQDRTPEVVSWKLHSSSGVHTLMTDEGLVVHMLIEKKYPLKKEILMQMLKLKLESEEESTMALELIRFIKKSWLVQDQTVLGKDYSNLLIADSLLKTIWFINAPCYDNEALASPNTNDEELSIPEQTATGKGTSNPLMAGSLPKTTKPT